VLDEIAAHVDAVAGGVGVMAPVAVVQRRETRQ
jgi:hypothetical protein